MDIQGLSKHNDSLLKLKGVIGVGAGTKHTGGIDTSEPCVVVFVREKLPLEKLDADQVVPQLLPDGTKTDVIEAGDVRILPLATEATTEVENRLRHRPVIGGVSISPGNFALSGTGGMIVYQDNTPCILSNNHVLRIDQIPNPDDRPQRGLYVRQPSFGDGGKKEDSLGEFWDWVEIAFPGPNETDQAIAKLTVPYVSAILGIGSPVGLAEPAVGKQVTKSGRTSGITTGKIIGINSTIEVGFGGGITAIFNNQIVSTAFMLAGDSGSVWVTEDKKIMGLGFAGSTSISVANPIQTVFNKLNLTLPPPVTPIEDILPQLGETTIWGFDNEAKTWSSFSSTVPERFRHLMGLRFLVPGNGYWIEVAKDLVLEHNGSVWKLWKGWNLIGWR